MSYNLQGIVRKASTNLTTEFDRLAYITQNIANTNTNAYKGIRFEDVIDADGSVYGVERKDFSKGAFLNTKNPLDVALDGAGFIPVTTLSGEIRYTRDGSFMTNKEGLLVTKNGDLVGSGILIDTAAEKIEIRPNGDVYTYKRLIDEPEYSGTIPVVQFKNPEGLKDMGQSNYMATEEAGSMKLVVDHQLVKQYGVETTNVDMANEIYTISRINASITASTSLMKAVNDMYSQAMNIAE